MKQLIGKKVLYDKMNFTGSEQWLERTYIWLIQFKYVRLPEGGRVFKVKVGIVGIWRFPGMKYKIQEQVTVIIC